MRKDLFVFLIPIFFIIYLGSIRVFSLLDNPDGAATVVILGALILLLQFFAVVIARKLHLALTFPALIMLLYFFINSPDLIGYEAQIISSPSNEPTLNYGDLVVTKKFKIKLNRGFFVRFNVDGKSFQKRIHGVPGDFVIICNQDVYINGFSRSAYNDWVPKPLSKKETCAYKIEKIALASDEYFLVGDNKFNSYDSRDFGVVKSKDITSYAIYKFRNGNVEDVVFLTPYPPEAN